MHYGFKTNNPISTLSMLVGDGEFWKIDHCVENDDPDRRIREKPEVRAYRLSVDVKHVPAEGAEPAGSEDGVTLGVLALLPCAEPRSAGQAAAQAGAVATGPSGASPGRVASVPDRSRGEASLLARVLTLRFSATDPHRKFLSKTQVALNTSLRLQLGIVLAAFSRKCRCDTLGKLKKELLGCSFLDKDNSGCRPEC